MTHSDFGGRVCLSLLGQLHNDGHMLAALIFEFSFLIECISYVILQFLGA